MVTLDRVPVAGDYIRLTGSNAVRVEAVGLIPAHDWAADVRVSEALQQATFPDLA